MSSSHHAIFSQLEAITFAELRSSTKLIELMRAKISLLDPSQFADQGCAEKVRFFTEVIRDVLEDRYQELSIRAFCHLCVALDYFLDPAEAIPDSEAGGFVDDLRFLVLTEQRFARELEKYRKWKSRVG